MEVRDTLSAVEPLKHVFDAMFTGDPRAFDVLVYKAQAPSVDPSDFSNFGRDVSAMDQEIEYAEPELSRMIEVSAEDVEMGFFDDGSEVDGTPIESVTGMIHLDKIPKRSVILWEEADLNDVGDRADRSVLMYVLDIKPIDRRGLLVPHYILIPFVGSFDNLPSLNPGG